MSHLDSLAGLDSMVLHINTRSEQSPTVSTLIAMDSESFVLVPRKIGKLGRASRTPLADKTPDFNTVCLRVLCIASLCTFKPVSNRTLAPRCIQEFLVHLTSQFRFTEIDFTNPPLVSPPTISLGFLHSNHFH